jgi:hypothetical protein
MWRVHGLKALILAQRDLKMESRKPRSDSLEKVGWNPKITGTNQNN